MVNLPGRPPRPGRPRERSGDDATVARITTAPPSLADDMAQRTRRYLVQMSIRVVCFVGAVAIDHWTRWLLLLGAVVLPYVAVLLANAGRERGTDPGTYLAMPALPGPPAGGSGPGGPRGGA